MTRAERKIGPFGDRALLAETATLADALALHAALAATRPPGLRELVPAARTVLAVVDPARLSLAAAAAWIADVEVTADAAAPGPLVEVPIRYDGADLADTAALLGVSADELVRRHAGARWRVAFTGFAPGFAYLVSEDWAFDVPRLASPRTRVPAGAVGLAGGFSGAYPRETPGGWRLIGTTDAPLFDAASADPVLLPPGARVRFVAPREPIRGATPPRTAELSRRHWGFAEDAAAIRVVEPGPLATVQDLGRAGRAHLGIARSGALDRAALRRANRLVGNPEGEAGVEILLGGFRAVALRDAWIAVTGAVGPIEVDGAAVGPNTAVRWPAGAELHVGAFAAGLRGYLAVRGGIAVAPVAGSRATDVLAGLGPGVLRAGDALPVGAAPADPVPALDVAPWPAPPRDLEVELAAGPRAAWFASSALPALFETAWTVTGDADRVGIRLDGPELPRARREELPSEGMVPGAIQVPPSGRPTILLADGPVTGGYPVIAVVADSSLDALAHARPGARIRFRHARPAPA
ncbi:5-oxoprolinase/urea amidolyase family protein [Microbacterium sp. 10M-3C3]|uniref:5-oxoprolinase subunit B/C family protein n=1 Tax=Microbacterium sp. 10M-3C3 TaxID=2483401 RepID=UPI00197C7FC1|nr:5-oxoprolinase/urea amidolyase family protein [Microbacterium sp. 10M-3C3]